MDLAIVVFAQLLFLFLGPAADRLAEVALGVFTTDHEADLAGRIGWDRGVCVFDFGEDLATIGFELGDERQVKPLVLGCRMYS